ncbi:hypothetical protein ACC808_29525 [Rhizobium ruizarguesonis]
MMELQQSLGLSYVFISHNMVVVERIRHRVAALYLGEVVEIGTLEEIFTNPQHDYTKRLLEAVPLPDPDRRSRRREITARDQEPDPGREMFPPCEDTEGSRTRTMS